MDDNRWLNLLLLFAEAWFWQLRVPILVYAVYLFTYEMKSFWKPYTLFSNSKARETAICYSFIQQVFITSDAGPFTPEIDCYKTYFAPNLENLDWLDIGLNRLT